MKIGVDLDNTIISYDRAFQFAALDQGVIESDCQYSKQDLREIIRNKQSGEIQWQKLQGYVYGKGIHKAELFQGVYRFLWRCSKRGVDVEVVSHKTEFGHFDADKCSLRDAATNFLFEHELLGKPSSLINKITYTDDRQTKVKTIVDNDFEWFIDDLKEVVSDLGLHKKKAILFTLSKDVCVSANQWIAKTWEQIDQFFFNSWEQNELKSLTGTLELSSEVDSIEKLKGRGNSAIYKLCLTDGRDLVLKVYSQCGYHDRLKTEFDSSTMLKELGFNRAQSPVACNHKLGVAAYEWIDGQAVDKYGEGEINQALSFLQLLNDCRVRSEFVNFPLAADACLSGLDIEKQIKRRLSQLVEVMDKHRELELFLKNDFETLLNEILEWSKKHWPEQDAYDTPIDRKNMVLSPSDFGFHNTLISSSGKLNFYDFEYFGWDDPTKVTADFSHHAAMNLSKKDQLIWFAGIADIYGKDSLARLKSAWPLYGLNWCLIVLNEFKSDVWSRRCAADDAAENQRDKLLQKQLKKARNKLNDVSEEYKDKFYW